LGLSVYCKGLTACAADPYYTNHVHKIGAKSIQNEAKSRPGAVHETLPKKNNKKRPKVNQKAPKVDQKAPQNDPKNVFKMIKNGLGAFVSTSKKDDNVEVVFSRFLAPAGGPRACKIKPKRCKGVQKRGYHLFKKSGTFLQKPIKNGFPFDPQRPPKIEKVLEKTFPKPTSKKHEKKGTRMKKKSSNVTQRNPT
jgi:hypothetical protein